MNRNIIVLALETLREQVCDSMDANDSHFSAFMQDKLSQIDAELDRINKLNTITNG